MSDADLDAKFESLVAPVLGKPRSKALARAAWAVGTHATWASSCGYPGLGGMIAVSRLFAGGIACTNHDNAGGSK